MKAALIPLALLFVFSAPGAVAEVALPALESHVTDTTGTLDDARRAALEQKLADFESRKGAQVAVVIVPTTEPETIEQYGVRLMEAWKLGRKGVDDGAALIVAMNDRTVRIEVQYGLEGALTDATSNRIIEDIIVPRFRQGDFAGGIEAGVDQMLRVIDGEELPPPDPKWQRGRSGGVPMPALIVGALIFASMLRPMLGRGPAAGLAGAGGGGIAWWLGSTVLQSVFAGFGIFVLALLFGIGGAGGGGFGGGGRVFRDVGRGWGGGGFGGGLGGGGWSGGGGLGGGGGASGRW